MSAATALSLHPVRASESPFPPALLQKRTQVRAKRGRGKAVTWLPEDQICQVRFFLSNDAPSTLGPAQDSLQVNHLRSLQSGALDAPPGFHGSLAKRSRIDNILEVSMAIGRPWLLPQKFVPDIEWMVAVGGESSEAAVQKQRELRVLEAFYPRLTCIPDSPAEPVEICKHLEDCLILTIPLVPIEEEDESSQEPEQESKVLERNHDSGLATSDHGNSIDDRKPELPTPRGSLPPMPELSKCWQESFISNVDPKVAAAAAAAAACMAVHKFGASGLVDQELLVEILRNPALLKSLTFLNQSSKDLAVSTNGNEVGCVGQPVKNQHNVNQSLGPLNKAKAPLNAGLPSPVSVLSDWTEEHLPKHFPRTPSNLSEISKFTQNFANVSSSIPPSLPHKDSYSPYLSRECLVRPESVPMQRMHACAQEIEMGINASHVPNVSAHTTSTVHVDRSSGMMLPPLSPFPSQNGVNFNSSMHGRMQPAQVLKVPDRAQIGVKHHHQHVPVLDSAPCRSSFSDARLRGTQNENTGPCSTTKAGSKSTRLCMYFNTPRGCRYGGNCAFLHQSSNPDVNAVAQ
eukprot:c21980_g1_i1 orf=69-1784(+)